MINEPLHLVTAFTIGLAFAALYLATLWVVVRRLPGAKHPGLLLLSSAVLRIVLLLAGWYWIADGSWEILLACLLGFLILRFAATRWLTAAAKRPMAS